jgi:hypothetical protein
MACTCPIGRAAAQVEYISNKKTIGFLERWNGLNDQIYRTKKFYLETENNISKLHSVIKRNAEHASQANEDNAQNTNTVNGDREAV